MVLYCNQTTAGRNRKLLDIVSTKGPNGYNELRHALLVDFKWLAELLDGTVRPTAPPAAATVLHSTSTMAPDTSSFMNVIIDVFTSCSCSYKVRVAVSGVLDVLGSEMVSLKTDQKIIQIIM